MLSFLFRTATFVTFCYDFRKRTIRPEPFFERMLSTPWIIVLAGIVCSITVLAIIAKRVAKPKKAERSEKAQILKQLLALSEGENTVKGISRQPSVSQSPTPRVRAAAAGASRSRTARPA